MSIGFGTLLSQVANMPTDPSAGKSNVVTPLDSFSQYLFGPGVMFWNPDSALASIGIAW